MSSRRPGGSPPPRARAARLALVGLVLGGTSAFALAPTAQCRGGDSISVIDVLAGYSPKARAEAGGDSRVKAQIAKGITLTNAAFSAGGIRARVRLVHSAYVDIAPKYDTQSGAALLAFATRNDGVADTLPTLRDRYGADQVTVITGGSAMGGIGYTPQAPGPAWQEWAYTIVARNAIAHYSFGHELGHNLGAHHDRTFPKKGDRSTLMAYESGCRRATGGACNRVNRFSDSPFLDRSAEAVSAYRTAKTDPIWCDVTLSWSPSVRAGRIVPKLMGPYTRTATATLTAVPAKGHVFGFWTLDGKRQSTKSRTIKVSMKSKDHTLKATFRKATGPSSAE